MSRSWTALGLVGLALTAGTVAATGGWTQAVKPTVTVYKTPT